MDNTYLVLAVLFFATIAVRTGYELLKEAGKVDLENKAIFAFVVIDMCTLWISWFILCRLDPYDYGLPDAVRFVGLAVFGAGMILALGALSQLKGLENIKHLVTTGMFARLRHPMYTGFCLWIVGWSIGHGAIVSLLIGSVGIINILYWRYLEEKRLLAQHGDAYLRYRSTTWF